MRIEHQDKNELIITGNIKTVGDSVEIKNMINAVLKNGDRYVNLNIKDSLSLTSAIIGYFIKLIHQEKVRLTITVGDPRLYSLLEELCLIQQFNVRLFKQQN